MTTLPRFLWRYVRPWRNRALALALVILATAIVQLAAPLVTARFIDDALAAQPHGRLIALALVVLGLTLSGQMLGVLETRIAESLGWSVTNQVRLDLTAHLLRLDYRFHTAHTQGDLIERVDGDVGHLSRLFSRFALNVIGNGLLVLGVLIVLVSIDVRLAAGIAIVVSSALILMLAIRKRATPFWSGEREASARFYGFLSEFLEAREAVQAGGMAARQFVVHEFLQRMRVWLRRSTRAGMWGYSLAATSTAMFTVALAYALAMGGYLHRTEGLTFGSLFLAIRLTDMLREPVQRLRDEIQDIQQSAASLARVRSLLSERTSVEDGAGTSLPDGPLSVEWKDVTFGYASHHPMLRNISLIVPAGRVLGIVGRTGSGKTTLARMVPRLIDPDEGEVNVGGVPVRSLRLAELRARIGVVAQDVQLFDASLRDNVTLFAPPGTTSDAETIDTLEQVGLSDWFNDLPSGLDTRIGNGGTGLSAGQAQLIACARVLRRDPEIVILDEASARLDPVSERRLHLAIARLIRNRTAVIIAHRLDTLALADDIAVIEEGELIEFGPRVDLAGDPHSRLSGLLRVDLSGAVQ